MPGGKRGEKWCGTEGAGFEKRPRQDSNLQPSD